MVITKIALSRRTVLRGLGATMALPFLDAMTPALTAQAKGVPRFTAIYVGNGATMADWTPPTDGAGFEYSPILKPVEAFRKQTVVVTNLDNAPGSDQGDTGGQHPRGLSSFMTCTHPKATEGADVRAGVSIDQVIAANIGRQTKLASLELGIDPNEFAGSCDHGYACAYLDSAAWKTPTTPLAYATFPRFVFERMFGAGGTAEERLTRLNEDRSILDVLTQQIADLRKRVGVSDRMKLGEYFDVIRDMEQRISLAERPSVPVPDAPVGVPAEFKDYVELMFDLQLLAFQADLTRVTSFVLARESVSRPYPQIGLPETHHNMSHHANILEKQKTYTKLNTYHVEMLGYYLKKLQATTDGDGSLLDNTAVLYGSGMSDGNAHNNYGIPAVVVGGQGLQIKGNRHVRMPKGTPLANLMLGLIDRYDVHPEAFGDSTGRIDLTSA